MLHIILFDSLILKNKNLISGNFRFPNQKIKKETISAKYISSDLKIHKSNI